MKTTLTLETLKSVLRQYTTFGPYRHESSRPKYDAQINLDGRTHYVDEDTLRGFRSRILSCHIFNDGLTLAIVESVGWKPENPQQNKRFVVFDVFGTVLNGRDQWHATSKAAERDMREFLNTHDAAKHTAETLRKNARRDIETAKQILKSL